MSLAVAARIWSSIAWFCEIFSGWVVDGVVVMVPDVLLLFFFLPPVEVVVANCSEVSVGSCELRVISR